jgi:diguanylate cyclase (GGDEF)-like protein
VNLQFRLGITFFVAIFVILGIAWTTNPIIAALFSLPIGLGLSWYLSRWITQPLAMIVRSVREVSLGKLPILPPSSDELGELASSFNSVAVTLHEELQAKALAFGQLEATREELVQVNHVLARRLFENKVTLNLWREQEKTGDTKELLSSLLEELLQGLPFHYGVVILRPLAQIGPEVVIASLERTMPKQILRPSDVLERTERTLWLSSLSGELKETLLNRNEETAEHSILGPFRIRASVEPKGKIEELTIVSLSLKQGSLHLGSLHLISDRKEMEWTDGDIAFLTSTAAQVSVILENRSLQYANRVDSLTRLYNRGYMMDRMREEMVRTSRTGRPFTFMLLDVDHFKKVNDTYGHQAGDEVLISLAALLKKNCRASDAICRYGGEEIALILADTALPGAKIFAENIRKTIETEAVLLPDNQAIKITASMGLAEFPLQAKSLEELIKLSDTCLYEAKRNGRNKWIAAP